MALTSDGVGARRACSQLRQPCITERRSSPAGFPGGNATVIAPDKRLTGSEQSADRRRGRQPSLRRGRHGRAKDRSVSAENAALAALKAILDEIGASEWGESRPRCGRVARHAAPTPPCGCERQRCWRWILAVSERRPAIERQDEVGNRAKRRPKSKTEKRAREVRPNLTGPRATSPRASRGPCRPLAG